RSNVRSDTDEPGCADRQVRQYVGVVTGEVEQVGLVQDAADLAEVTLRILHSNDVRMLRSAQDRLAFDRDARAPRNVVEDNRKVGRVGDHAEVGAHSWRRGLVVVRGHDHDAVGAGLLTRLVQLDRVRGLVGATPRDDLRAVARTSLRHLDALQLLRVGERAGLPRRAGDDNAVSTLGDHIVDVLLDVAPVDFAVCGERGYQGDKHLAEGILSRRHTYRVP